MRLASAQRAYCTSYGRSALAGLLAACVRIDRGTADVLRKLIPLMCPVLVRRFGISAFRTIRALAIRLAAWVTAMAVLHLAHDRSPCYQHGERYVHDEWVISNVPLFY